MNLGPAVTVGPEWREDLPSNIDLVICTDLFRLTAPVSCNCPVLVATYNCLFILGVFTPATNFCSLYARSCDESFTLCHCRYELEVSFSGLDTGLPPKIG
jgi:hypothetical protein